MSKKQNYTSPEVEAFEVKTEGVIMLSQAKLLSIMASSTSIDAASSYTEGDAAITW